MMKVENILIVIGVLSSATLYAQNTIKIEPFVTAEGGDFPSMITLGEYTYLDAEASTIEFSFPSRSRTGSPQTGLYLGIGAMLEYPLAKRISLRAGIGYANRHFEANRSGTSSPVATIFRLSYVDIPVLARYYFLAKRITLYADAGVATSPRVHNVTVIRRPSARRDNHHIEDAPIHEVMLMGQFSLGAGVRFNRSGLSVSGTYRNGITKFATTDNYRFKALGVNTALFFIIGDPQ
jgi:hypothetical protein